MTIGDYTIQVVFFDFSGVLAEEGFVQGMKEIGRQNGLDPNAFLRDVTDICFTNGYATGKSDEHRFWQDIRNQTGIESSDTALRKEILSRFVIRQWMLQVVSLVRTPAIRTALLSDHTNWLEELDAVHGIYKHFDRVFNSFREGMTKRSLQFFEHACTVMNVSPANALFIDDNPANTTRAQSIGLHTITYTSYGEFIAQLKQHVGGIVMPPEGTIC